jgi:hypothetical protein
MWNFRLRRHCIENLDTRLQVLPEWEGRVDLFSVNCSCSSPGDLKWKCKRRHTMPYNALQRELFRLCCLDQVPTLTGVLCHGKCAAQHGTCVCATMVQTHAQSRTHFT